MATLIRDEPRDARTVAPASAGALATSPAIA